MLMLKKVCVIGHFAFGKNALNGQTVKTQILTQELYRRYQEEQVSCMDTAKGWKTLLLCRGMLKNALKQHQNVVILPAQNGLRVIAPLLSRLKKAYPNRRIHYVVVGGWLPTFLQNRPKLKGCLMAFDGIYVETSTLQKALQRMGFDNVFVMPNCKPIPPLTEGVKQPSHHAPCALCICSRVMAEKGIGDAVEAVRRVNTLLGREAATLTIYGQVDRGQVGWFDTLQAGFPPYITYGGELPYLECAQTLQRYDAMLFPTHYATEGIPGSIIDGYSAGLPVITARWESFDDMVTEGVTGWGYPMDAHPVEALTKVLLDVVQHPESLLAMREACLEKAKVYEPSLALDVLCGRL